MVPEKEGHMPDGYWKALLAAALGALLLYALLVITG